MGFQGFGFKIDDGVVARGAPLTPAQAAEAGLHVVRRSCIPRFPRPCRRWVLELRLRGVPRTAVPRHQQGVARRRRCRQRGGRWGRGRRGQPL
jgi:hypothetical protein